MAEVTNALDQARKEITTRFDFRDAAAEITIEKTTITLTAVNDFKLKALHEIVMAKLAKRGVSLKNFKSETAEISSVGRARQEVKIQQGMETEQAKKIVAAIKETNKKLQAQIQDRQVRVTGKSRDELQAVIAALRGQDFGVGLGFQNFRD